VIPIPPPNLGKKS